MGNVEPDGAPKSMLHAPLVAGTRRSHAQLIYNPTAGFWDWGPVVQKVARFWGDQGWSVDIEATGHTGHATELAEAAAAKGCAMVLAAGGDGTLHEIANGLVGTSTILAPLPVGTSNSFAKELGLSRPNVLHQNYLLEVSHALAQGRVQTMDVGRTAHGRYWLLWASTGIDGFVVKRIEPRARWFKRLGPAGYLARALFFLPRFEAVHARVTVDAESREGDYLLLNVSNCRMWLGGELRLNQHAVLDDGLFEVWLFRGKHWPRALTYGLEITLEDHVRDPHVTVLQGRSITIETDEPIHYHLDGEPMAETPLQVTLCPGALRLLAPDTTPDGLFSLPGAPLAAITP